MKVLVRDDVGSRAKAAANALFQDSINPDVAENGAQAINKIPPRAAKYTYQLIILDWKKCRFELVSKCVYN